MCLRHTTRGKDGKTHVYWQLVRSVRLGRKVVQETVAQLGELDAEGHARARGLARSISGRAAQNTQGCLFESAQVGEVIKVRLDAVRLERARSFGAVWLGCELWQALKLDELLSVLLLSRGRELVIRAALTASPAMTRTSKEGHDPGALSEDHHAHKYPVFRLVVVPSRHGTRRLRDNSRSAHSDNAVNPDPLCERLFALDVSEAG